MRDGPVDQAKTEPKEESYLGSISDLMSGLLFVFIITVAVFALRLAEATKQVANTIDEVDNAQIKLMEDLQQRLQLHGMQVAVDPDHRVLRIGEDGIYFKTGEARPSNEHRDNVGKLAQALVDILPCYVADARKMPPPRTRPGWCGLAPPDRYNCKKGSAKVETVLIEGHTDKRRVTSGKYEDNLDLSSARAGNILRMLTECQPDLDELRNSKKLRVLGVSGYAEKRPVDENLLDPNRRIDLRFIMELPKRPDSGS